MLLQAILSLPILSNAWPCSQDLHSVFLSYFSTRVDFIHFIPEEPFAACVRLQISSLQSSSGFPSHTVFYSKYSLDHQTTLVLHHRIPSHNVWTVRCVGLLCKLPGLQHSTAFSEMSVSNNMF